MWVPRVEPAWFRDEGAGWGITCRGRDSWLPLARTCLNKYDLAIGIPQESMIPSAQGLH